MPFRPNYRGDRLARDRAARIRADEKQKKREEKSAKRKAERSGAEGSSDPRTDYLRNHYLDTDSRVRCSIDSMSLIPAEGLPYNDAALDSRAQLVMIWISFASIGIYGYKGRWLLA